MRSGWAWVRLIHPFPSFVVAATGLGLALALAPLSPAEAARLWTMLLASQVAIGALNEYCDAPLDRLGQPGKPIPSGRVPRAGALGLSVVGLLTSVFLMAGYGPSTLLIGITGLSVGVFYDLRGKGSIWGWVPYVVAIPLLPLWVWSAIGVLELRTLWVYPLGALLALCLHIANTVPDYDADLAAGSRTVVHAIGLVPSVWLLRGCFGVLLLLGLGLIALVGWSRPVALVGLPGAVLGGVGTFLAGAPAHARLAFRLLAAGAGLLAVCAALTLRSG